MKLSLVVLTTGKWEGKAIPVTLPQFLIGRDPQCHLRPASPVISKRHCAVIQRNGKVLVRDFGSTNGTFINDDPVKGEAEMKAGDELRVGPLSFKVVIEVPATVNPPVNVPTPIPASKPSVNETAAAAATAATRGDDESAAADMLMSILDDGPGPISSGEVPEGSTVMDIPVPKAEDNKKNEKDKPKTPTQSTSNAAKSILEKYMRRPRPAT